MTRPRGPRTIIVMLTFLTAGESHGPQVTAIVDGLPAGLPISIDAINHQLSRRQKGYGRGGRMKIETDRVQVLSGVRHGFTMGGPITLVVANKDWENWSEIMDPFVPVPEDIGLRKQRLVEHTVRPRPGHADLAGGIKWNHKDLRNVLERASARETTARVAAGATARQLLHYFDIDMIGHVVRIAGVTLADEYVIDDLETAREITEASDVRCLDEATGNRMIEAIRAAKKKSDSVGGVAEVVVRNLPVGLGGLSQWSDRLDGKLAQALMSIHSAKGVEIGQGFRSAELRGSEVHDEIVYHEDAQSRRKGFHRTSNRAGGLEGGMTNGEDLVVRVASKPISTLNRPLRTVNVVTKEAEEAMVERTDNCVVPALAVVCEAVVSLVLADAFLDKFGGDNIAETERNFASWLNTPY